MGCIEQNYPAPVAKTGQITPYDPRDDGALQKGVAWPTPRFTDNKDYTVTDNLTGLIWMKNPSPVQKLDWQNSMKSFNGSTLNQPWRVPNVKELCSLLDYGQSNPALPADHPFSNVQSNYFWTSTTYTPDKTRGWVVNLKNGVVDAAVKSNGNYVWPVRGGQ